MIKKVLPLFIMLIVLLIPQSHSEGLESTDGSPISYEPPDTVNEFDFPEIIKDDLPYKPPYNISELTFSGVINVNDTQQVFSLGGTFVQLTNLGKNAIYIQLDGIPYGSNTEIPVLKDADLNSFVLSGGQTIQLDSSPENEFRYLYVVCAKSSTSMLNYSQSVRRKELWNEKDHQYNTLSSIK